MRQSDHSQTVLVVGDCRLEMAVPLPGQQADSRLPAIRSWMGGGALPALALCRLDIDTALLSVLGDDSFAKGMLRQLAGAGVDIGAVALQPVADTGCVFHFVDRQDNEKARAAWPVHRGGQRVWLDNIDWPAIETAGWLHIDGSMFEAGEPAQQAAVEALQRAQWAGVPTSMSIGGDAAALAGLRWALLEAVDYSDYVLGDAAHFSLLYPHADWRQSARYFAQRQRVSVVRLRAEGSAAYAHNGSVVKQGLEPVALDARGADAAYDAAFIAARLGGRPLVDAVVWGNAAWYWAAGRRTPGESPSRYDVEQLADRLYQKEQAK